MEGLGAPLVVDAAPRILHLPGTLTTGSVASGSVTLQNPTHAPAHFSVEVLPLPADTTSTSALGGAHSSSGNGIGGTSGLSSGGSQAVAQSVAQSVSVSPSSGSVDALSELQLRVTFSALHGLLGQQEVALLVHVDHGPSIPVQVCVRVDVTLFGGAADK